MSSEFPIVDKIDTKDEKVLLLHDLESPHPVSPVATSRCDNLQKYGSIIRTPAARRISDPNIDLPTITPGPETSPVYPVSGISDNLKTLPCGNASARATATNTSNSGVARLLMAVFLSAVVNFLDAVTFGLILFPYPFTQYGASLGIATFLFSVIQSQALFILCSGFGAVAITTSAAQHIPFLHTIAHGINQSLLAQNAPQESFMPTIMAAYSISTFINGIIFYLCGYLRFASILKIFPTHLIIGCVGGYGWFLTVAALEIGTGLNFEVDFVQSVRNMLTTAPYIWMTLTLVLLWIIQLLVEKSKVHEMAGSLFMLLVPVGFFLCLRLASISWDDARSAGWMFPEEPPAPFWSVWRFFAPHLVYWKVIPYEISTMLSMSLFNLLLIPINLQSLATTLKMTHISIDDELKLTGISNLIIACAASIHNYVSFANSSFYIRNGGHRRVGGVLLVLLTLILFLCGPSLINYVPRVVAGLVLLPMGIDVLYSALVLERHRCDCFEYLSIWLITLTIAFAGFVKGIALGAILACITFVLQIAQLSSFRAVYSGKELQSSSLYHEEDRRKLQRMRRDERILVAQLDGDMFFANAQKITQRMNQLLQQTFPSQGVSNRAAADGAEAGNIADTTTCYFILDISHVTGMDSTTANAILQLMVDVRARQPPVIIFLTGLSPQKYQSMMRLKEDIQDKDFDLNAHITDTVDAALVKVEEILLFGDDAGENLIMSMSGGNLGDYNPNKLYIVDFLKRICEETLIAPQVTEAILLDLSHMGFTQEYPAGTILWTQGDAATRGGILLKGEVQTRFQFQSSSTGGSTGSSVEKIHPGNAVGFLGLITNRNHTREAIAVKDSVVLLWDRETMQRLYRVDPRGLATLEAVALAVANARLRQMAKIHVPYK